MTSNKNQRLVETCKHPTDETAIHECESFHATRRKRGRGFEYHYLNGQKISDKQLLRRFKHLAIPPMWIEVRISVCQQSKIQAFGFDQRQRKQYVYHSLWEQQRQAEKFSRLADFAHHLPTIRKAYADDLSRPVWDRQKASALALLLLDRTGIRIGNRHYSEANGTVGLTTLRRKHITENDAALSLEFTGKHGKARHISINDDTAGQLISESAAKPGYPLLRYRSGSQWQDLLSDDVNERLRELVSLDVSAKDFRTWTGTRLAMQLAHRASTEVNQHPRRKFIPTLVKLVAAELGNTPAICEKYYIHPSVQAFLHEEHQRCGSSKVYEQADDWLDTDLSPSENAVLEAISSQPLQATTGNLMA